jgi:hypothetical protein
MKKTILILIIALLIVTGCGEITDNPQVAQKIVKCKITYKEINRGVSPKGQPYEDYIIYAGNQKKIETFYVTEEEYNFFTVGETVVLINRYYKVK